jgi:hypothetical protein
MSTPTDPPERRTDTPQMDHSAITSLSVYRIRRLVAYEVMESDMQNLEQVIIREVQAIGFATAGGGTLLGWCGSWLGAGELEGFDQQLFVLVAILLAAITARWVANWVQARAERTGLLSRLKQQAHVVERQVQRADLPE